MVRLEPCVGEEGDALCAPLWARAGQRRRSLALAEELNDMSIRIAVLNNLALVCKSYGEIKRAITLTQDALALCESQGDLHREAALYSNLADLFHEYGNAEVAMSYLKQSVSIFADIGEEVGIMRPEIWKLVEW